jgi:hypothetical protein
VITYCLYLHTMRLKFHCTQSDYTVLYSRHSIPPLRASISHSLRIVMQARTHFSTSHVHTVLTLCPMHVRYCSYYLLYCCRFMQDWAVAVIQRLVRGWLAHRIVAAKAVEVKLSHRVAFLANTFVKKGCLDVWGFLQQVGIYPFLYSYIRYTLHK